MSLITTVLWTLPSIDWAGSVLVTEISRPGNFILSTRATPPSRRSCERTPTHLMPLPCASLCLSRNWSFPSAQAILFYPLQAAFLARPLLPLIRGRTSSQLQQHTQSRSIPVLVTVPCAWISLMMTAFWITSSETHLAVQALATGASQWGRLIPSTKAHQSHQALPASCALIPIPLSLAT